MNYEFVRKTEEGKETFWIEIGDDNIYLLYSNSNGIDADVMDSVVTSEFLERLNKVLQENGFEAFFDNLAEYVYIPFRHGVSFETLFLLWSDIYGFLTVWYKTKELESKEEHEVKTVPIRDVVMTIDEWWDEYSPILDEYEDAVRQDFTDEEFAKATNENRIWSCISPFGDSPDYYINKNMLKYAGGMVVHRCITEKPYIPSFRITALFDEGED